MVINLRVVGKKIAIVLLVIGSLTMTKAEAQYAFQYNDIPVRRNQSPLQLPWAGGLNSAQYNAQDLDGDGEADLILFDRTANKLTTFLWTSNGYEYSPEYESSFPDALVSWMLLRDFDCDGDNDLFTDSQLGLRVFENTGSFPPSWELVSDPLLTLGTQVINLFFNDSDIPAIEDLDGDGDLDILAYNFATGTNIDFHQNVSVENTGDCGLDFVRITRTYGDIFECDCGDIRFNELCAPSGRLLHTGGKALLAIDLDGDSDKELLTGEEGCDELTLLTNQGNSTNPVFTAFSNFLELNSVPNLIFPAVYHLDLDHDGLKDLVISPNLRTDDLGVIDFTASSFLLLNTGSISIPEYRFEQPDFLQNEMIDVGTEAFPAFFDFDGDGDQDLFVGSLGSGTGGGFIGSVFLYENTGTETQPEFTESDNDYASLSSLNFRNIRPQFIDLTDDGAADLVFSATDQNGDPGLYHIPNRSNGSSSFVVNDIAQISDLSALSNYPTLTDVDSDGVIDLLIGRRIGTLEYYRNLGTNPQPNFQLEDADFLNISTSVERIDLVPMVADLRRDGSLDLVTTDASGELSIYNNYQDSPEPVRSVISSALVGSAITSDLGRISWPAVSDLYGNGSIDMVVGTISGGLFLLRDSTNQDSDIPNEDITFEVFPNPSQGLSEISVRSNARGTIEVFDISGKEVSTQMVLVPNQPLRISTFGYLKGVYLIRYRSDSRRTITRRLIISD